MKLKANERVILGIIIIFIAAISVFLGTRKTDYYIDELWTYGLANNIGSTQPEIEFGKEYSGMGPYETFFEVRSGEGFNYVNVWQNQAGDVHPPLYYVMINTVCSIFPNTFSKWYGILVNIFWMVGISILLYKLAKEITDSIAASAGIVLAYETSVIFMNTLLFIRMYAQVTFFVIAFAYLLKLYWDKELNKRFFIYFIVIAVLGMMTHYYFLIIAFVLCLALGIHLIKGKRFIELRNAVLVAIGSGIIFILCWYHFLGHLFRGYRGKEAISAAFSIGGLLSGAEKMFAIINQEAFAGLMVVFAVAIIALGVIKLRKEENILGCYEAVLFISAMLYVMVVGKIAPYRDDRYLMPVIFALFIVAYIVVRALIKKYWSAVLVEYTLIFFFLGLNLFNFAKNDFNVKMDFYNEEKEQFMASVEGKDYIVYVDDNWEALYYYTALQHAGSYTFVNSENVGRILAQQDGEYILASIPGKVEDIVDRTNAKQLYFHGQDAYYLVED